MNTIEKKIKRDIEDIAQLIMVLVVLIMLTVFSVLIVRAVPVEVETETIFYSGSNDKRLENLEYVKHSEAEVISEMDLAEETTMIKKPLTNEERICLMVDGICEEMNFDKPELIKSMIFCESSFNKNSISKAGAQGLMQITPRYFTDLMKEFNVTDLCEDEEGNIRIGIFWINRLINKYNGDLHKALVAYNCGETYVYKNGITSSSYSKKVIRIAGDYIV